MVSEPTGWHGSQQSHWLTHTEVSSLCVARWWHRAPIYSHSGKKKCKERQWKTEERSNRSGVTQPAVSMPSFMTRVLIQPFKMQRLKNTRLRLMYRLNFFRPVRIQISWDLTTVKVFKSHSHHFHTPQALLIGDCHSRRNHSHQDRNHPLWDRGDHSEQRRIDLQWPFPEQHVGILNMPAKLPP